MRLLHLSDLHLGKRVNEFSMLEDQAYILGEILEIAKEEQPDAVLIAGDVYDKSVPSAEAVELLDDFLVRLSRQGPRVLLIGGNHDSPERLAFGGRLMEGSGVHLAPVYDGSLSPVTLEDRWGAVNIYLLSFLKPAHVRRFFPDRELDSYTAALSAVLESAAIDRLARNVLVTHQFVTGAARCDSEERSVGGTDNVDLEVFDGFDYVALGHIHGPQQVGRPTVRYCGTPLKYSFSEVNHQKSVTVVELGPKGEVGIRLRPLTPRREMAELRGSYEELTYRGFYRDTGLPEKYLRITLTDEEDIPGAMDRLRVIYPYLMRLDYDNRRTRAGAPDAGEETGLRRSPMELLEEFYTRQNGGPMGPEQRACAQTLMEEIWEGAQ